MSTTFQGFLSEGAISKSTPLVYKSVALATADIISQTQTNITLMFGINTGVNARYFQVFEKKFVPAPGDIPEFEVFVPVGGQFSWTPSLGGRVFSAVSWGVSTTAATYTAAAEIFFVTAEGFTL